jgi:hypothetical protein
MSVFMPPIAMPLAEPPERTLDTADAVIEAMLQRVRLRARRRIAWLRKVWTESGKENPANDYHSEVDGYLNNADDPQAEADWLAGEEDLEDWNQALAATEQRLARDSDSRLALLVRTFGLNQAETDVLHACLAIALEPNLGRVYAYLQDHNGRDYVTEALVARLFGYGRCLPISTESPLKTWGLVVANSGRPGEQPRLECDPFVRNWLLGVDDLDEALMGLARVIPAPDPLSNWPVEETVATVAQLSGGELQERVRLLVAGAEGSGRRSFVACVGERLGMPLLALNSDRMEEPHWPSVFMRTQRQAYLSGYALAWYGESMGERTWPTHISWCGVQFIIGEVDEFLPPEAGVIDYRVEMADLSLDERRRLWKEMVPAAAHWPEEALVEMLQRRKTSIGQIVTVAHRKVKNLSEATEVLNGSSRRRLGSLAQPLSSSFHWNDLVVPDWLCRGLEDFLYEATERTALWENDETQRLFPQGKGLIALFAGPPGTGKTMAAQVIANTLQLELFRIDLSSMVSKYIGETAKNIERILSRAQRMDVVLLFDEADALFGKRTEIKDAHDRFANTDTNYLLQAIEQYPGIAILASNKKANIDAGFTRRLRYVLEFPKPDASQRLQLLRGLVGELAGNERAASLDKDLKHLAESLEITGAQIKFSILSALFMARKEKNELALPHLLRGLERELMKEGRGLGRQMQETLKQLSKA